MQLVDEHLIEDVFSTSKQLDQAYLTADVSPHQREFKELRQWASVKEELMDWMETTAVDRLPELDYELFNEYFQTGERKQYDHAYNEKRRRLHALTLLYIMDSDLSELLGRIKEIIWDICAENTWCLPAHLHHGNAPMATHVDMAAAETAFSLMEITYLLKNELPDWFVNHIIQEIERRVLIPYFIQNDNMYWETWTNNWSAVCGGAIGLSLLYHEQLSFEYQSEIDMNPKYMKRIIKCLSYYLKGFEEDGSCREGLAYWRYGFGYFVYFIDALKIRSSHQIDLYQLKKVRRIANFASVLWFTEGYTANFSDSPENIYLHTGMMHRLKQNIPEMILPHLTKYTPFAEGSKTWGNCSRNLMWSDDEVLNSRTIQPFSYLPSSQIIVMKKIMADSKILSIALKGGSNTEPHNHNDLGHFIIHVNGKNVLKDIGPAEYSKSYFSDQRYTYLEASSRGHSVPVINGYEQCHDNDCESYIEDIINKKDTLNTIFDLTDAYKVPGLLTFKRLFKYKNNQKSMKLKILDTFVFKSESGQITERFVSSTQPVLKNESIIVWPEHQLELHFSEPERLEIMRPDLTKKEGNRSTYIISLHYQLDHKKSNLDFTFKYTTNKEGNSNDPYQTLDQ